MMKSLMVLPPLLLIFTACQNKKEVYVDNTIYKENKTAISTINNTKQETLTENKKLLNSTEPLISQELILESNVQEEDSLDMNKALMDFYDEWKHVKYRLGGNSKRGIDCSAFTQRIFKEKFDVKIPRTTRTQVKVGKRINKSELEMGDLVFFKTGKTDRHVGVYMGDGTFMHASIKGIKFTKLNKPFYKRTYWTSRRIIN